MARAPAFPVSPVCAVVRKGRVMPAGLSTDEQAEKHSSVRLAGDKIGCGHSCPLAMSNISGSMFLSLPPNSGVVCRVDRGSIDRLRAGASHNSLNVAIVQF
jgi:hypothetical protein